jgi:hypothetical protein
MTPKKTATVGRTRRTASRPVANKNATTATGDSVATRGAAKLATRAGAKAATRKGANVAKREGAKVAMRKGANVAARKGAKAVGTKSPIQGARTKSITASAGSMASDFISSLAGISSAAVRKATGHGWDWWLKALDKAGAVRLPHREIARLLDDRLGLSSPWWAQMIAVGYEQARGLRKPNQTTLGFVASVSRTVAVPLGALYAAWEEGRRADWLPDAIEVRRATRNKSMRITWPDGSGINVNFYAKGGEKAVVAVEQSKLPDEGAVRAAKDLWNSTLDRLKSTLEAK